MTADFAKYDGVLGPGSFTNASFDPITGQAVGTDVSGADTGLDQTYVLFGEYDINLSGGSIITLRADMQHRSELPGPPNRAGNLTLDGDREAFSRPAIDNVGANIIWTSADGDTVVTLWGKNLGDAWDWKNIGPPIGFHYAVPGGMGPGEAGRGFSGRKQVGLDASLQQRAASLDEAFVVHGDTLSVPVFRIEAAGFAAKVGGLKSHHMMYNLMLISLAFEVRP